MKRSGNNNQTQGNSYEKTRNKNSNFSQVNEGNESSQSNKKMKSGNENKPESNLYSFDTQKISRDRSNTF